MCERFALNKGVAVTQTKAGVGRHVTVGLKGTSSELSRAECVSKCAVNRK